MVTLKAILDYLHDYLDVEKFSDYAPNGMQVEGRGNVRKIVSGVTASLAMIDAAVAARADALLVHHGYFWRGENPCVVGMKRNRLRQLLANDLSLVAYHLPLDAHPECGNNVQLARMLGLEICGNFFGQGALACQGRLKQPISPDAFVSLCNEVLGVRAMHIATGRESISRVGWCTGAAQNYISDAALLGLDIYLSGEISEQTVHVAREMGIDYVAAGHHATERYGVKALGEHLAEKFDIEHEFIDIPNPV